MLLKISKQAVMVAAFGALILPGPVQAASVKPLEVFSERIVVLEIENFASEHSISEEIVRSSLDRLNKGLNIMSQENVKASLKLLADARQSVAAAERSASALSSYIDASRSQLKAGGHERYFPLAKLYLEIEKPYHGALDRFLATAGDFVQYCRDNLEPISTGQAAARERYDLLYGSYLRDMEAFNQQSMKRSQLIADWATEYPPLMELLPR